MNSADSEMQPLVSIIMPAYNAGKYIADSIRTAQEQRYSNWELIVIDDGSTDDTVALVNSFSATDPRVKIIRQKNGRQGKARNNGIRNSTGELIAFLDADDLWVPEKLDVQIKKMRETQADLLFSDGFICLDNDMTRRDTSFKTISGEFQGKEALNLFYRINRIPISTVLCTRQALLDGGMFEENPGSAAQGGEDYAVWVAMLQKGFAFYGMTEKLLLYRVHNESSTAQEQNQLEKIIGVIFNFGIRPAQPAVLQLFEKYRRLLEILNEKGRLNDADALVNQLCRRVFSQPLSTGLAMLWKLNKRAFISFFWRYSSRKLAAENGK